MTETSKIEAKGPHEIRAWRIVPVYGWLIAGGAMVLPLLFGALGVLAGLPLMAVMGFGIALVIPAGLWLFMAVIKLRRVIVLRRIDDAPVWCFESWERAEVAKLPGAAFWTHKGRRVPVLDALEGHYKPFDPWRAPLSDVSSEDMARALEQSAARMLFEVKSKSLAETVKIGAMAALVGGFAFVIFLMVGEVTKGA